MSYPKISGGLSDSEVNSLIRAKGGWAQYSDTQYTEGSPFTVADGVTATIPNNAGIVLNTYLPSGVVSFYDSTTKKITPRAIGDYYIITTRFKAKNTAANSSYVEFGIDIGGSFGQQFKEAKLFVKGANIEQDFSIVSPCYDLDTFIANGGLPKIKSVGGVTSIYKVSYQIVSVFAA